jgi:hypothetical protein
MSKRTLVPTDLVAPRALIRLARLNSTDGYFAYFAVDRLFVDKDRFSQGAVSVLPVTRFRDH